LPQLSLPDPLACRARFSYGKGLRKLREHTRAEKELGPVVELCHDDNLRPRAMYVLGSSQSIIDIEHGVKTYDALAADYPAHPFADDALFFAADLELKLHQPDEAVARLELLAKKHPDGDYASEALFKSFWIARAQGKRAEAMGYLDTIESRYAQAAESYDVERERYWRARMVESEDPKAAQALLAELAQNHPATYYGLVARQRLADQDPKLLGELAIPAEVARTDGDIWPLHAGSMAKDRHFQAGIELLRLGFPEAAVSELMAVDRTDVPNEALRLLVYAVSKTGDAKSAHQLARVSLRRDLGAGITPATRPFWEIAYPPAFRDQVEKYATEAKFDPDLLQALMREESALDPEALSWAGAYGLTQLMPSTARAVARELHLKRPSNDSLLDPDLNLHLGATYLGRLLRRFGGNPFYALASYNAGPGAVNAWREAKPTLELDEWVEEIPIAETRGYVKRVLRSYDAYHLLYPSKMDTVKPEGPPVR
jgi:soluble lytic murein transglycosylase